MMAVVTQAALLGQIAAYQCGMGGLAGLAGLGQQMPHTPKDNYDMEEDLKQLLSDWDKNYLLDEVMK